MNRFLGLIIFLSVVLFSCGEPSTEDQLLGSWYFSFEDPNASGGQVVQVEIFYNFNSDGTVLNSMPILEEMQSEIGVGGITTTSKWSLSEDKKKLIVTMDTNPALGLNEPMVEEIPIESISSSELCLGIPEDAPNAPYDKLCASKISDEEFFNLTSDFISMEEWIDMMTGGLE